MRQPDEAIPEEINEIFKPCHLFMQSGNHPGFTRRYNLTRLVYYEFGDDIASAIAREKQIKGGSRKDKIDLILSLNPECKDLFTELFESETIPSPERQT